jgi:hypothetical protein
MNLIYEGRLRGMIELFWTKKERLLKIIPIWRSLSRTCHVHVLQGVEPSPIQTQLVVKFQCVQSLPHKEIVNVPEILIGRRQQDCFGAMIIAEAQHILCGGEPSARVSRGCLSQHPRGLFLTALPICPE